MRTGDFVHDNHQSRKNKEIQKYIERLERDQPDVLLTANFLRLGGIRQHMLAIDKYSSLNVQPFPNDRVLNGISRFEIETVYSENIRKMLLPKLKAIHTHVFPWAIRQGQYTRSTGVRWIHTYHLLYSSEHALEAMPSWQQEFNASQINEARKADVCLSVSNWQSKSLLEEYGINSMYLPNGVDFLSCEKASAARFRSQYALSGAFVLYIGRDDPVKNPGEFANVAKQMPDLQFVMVGRALDSDYLESSFGVTPSSNITFLPEVPHETALDAIAASSLLVVTSKREGLPTLVLEAMAQSKPVVASNEPGCTEVLGNGEFGFLYELGDVADLKQKIIQALSDFEKPIRARQRVIDHYDWRVIAPQLDRIYLRKD
jgi:glycosyltransferase involved in cell wall biosynthesis